MEGELKELSFHQNCYNSYVHPKTLDRIIKQKIEEQEQQAAQELEDPSPSTSSARKSTRKRDRGGKLRTLPISIQVELIP